MQLQDLLYHIDDIENRNRRNNIKFRVLPETVESGQLNNTLQNLFSSLLAGSIKALILLDRAYRAMDPRRQNVSRDVICRVQYYIEKEALMSAARSNPPEYEGTPFMFLHDLSRRTLSLRWAPKPLLAVLQKQDIRYRWGYTFQLNGVQEPSQVSKLPHCG